VSVNILLFDWRLGGSFRRILDSLNGAIWRCLCVRL